MPSTDRAALSALFHSTGGANWKTKDTWDTDANLSQWHGVKVDAQGLVVTLFLQDNFLQGQIPPELGNLSELTELDLSRNQLTGPIPPELGKLAALTSLYLNGNQLDGSIPPELGKLTALKKLHLWNNQLSGPIPPELGNLRELKTLSLGGNQLTGHIPRQLGDLGALETLELSDNRLEGPIPLELGNLAALQYLRLGGNQLTGSIPPELGKLTALKKLYLWKNQLSGTIPEALGELTALEELYLNNNNLSGPIPKELGALRRLEKLRLNSNKLTGSIPPELGNLRALKALYLRSNQLSGSIPPELGNLRSLKFLYLGNNQLSEVWNHSSDFASGNEPEQGCAAGVSVPTQLGELLAVLSNAEANGTLAIGRNPWKEPPEAVVEKGMSAVSGYFNDLFAEGVTPVPRRMIKVVLVGQEFAGKTSLRQSIRNRRPTPTSGLEESTVQIDVEEMEMDVDGVSLRVYDCAGQVAYTGLLQIFLSPRAVSLLVCNTEAFGQQDDCSSDRDQLKQDLHKLQELRVCDWLRSLSFRIPDSDVVVVATKCDLAGGMAASLAGRMARAIRKWLEIWRGSQMTTVRVEDGVSLTSCVATPEEKADAALGKRKKPEESVWACDWREDTRDDSPPSLLHRVMYNSEGDLRGAAMVLPRSWNIALQVLEALGYGRDPVESVHRMNLAADGPEGGKGLASTRAKQHKGIEGLTMAELSAKWSDVVETLGGDGVKITNPDHALEGALCIREYEGSLVRHEIYVFLDVAWLARILKPLLNHRDDEDPLCGSISLGDTGITLDHEDQIASWIKLKERGILEPALAGVLWPDGLSDYVLPTLHSLGLAHPLDGGSTDGLVVLLRLGKDRPNGVGKELDDFRRDHTAVLSVTWKVFMGVPPGAIEKVLTRCCSIGALQTFWRFGVLVQGGVEEATAVKTFALLMEYSHENNEIDMKVYGNICTAAPWAALSFGVSAVRMMCSEFPGLRWRASLECPQHQEKMQISNVATQPGDKLLCGKTCSLCSPETGGLGAAATELLEITDVRQSRGEVFTGVHERFTKLQRRFPILRSEASGGLHPEQAQRRFDDWLNGMTKEVNGLLQRSKESNQEEGVGGSTTVGGADHAGVVLEEEVAKLRQLVEEVHTKLGQQHQDVRGWLGTVGKRFAHGIDADDGVMGRLDFVVDMLMAVRSEGFDTPRMACVLPPWTFAEAHGLSEDEQKPEVWTERFKEWREDDFKEGKGFLKKKKILFLVCAHTRRLVPCGPNGQGYDIQQPRTWFRISVSVMTFALQVVCSTLAAIAAAPVSGAGAAAEAAISAGMEKLGSTLEAQLARVSLDDDADVDVGAQAAQLERRAYASLREFIHGVEDTARLEIAKAKRGRGAAPGSSKFVFFEQKMVQVQRRAGDAAVQWVLKGQEKAWLDAMKLAQIGPIV